MTNEDERYVIHGPELSQPIPQGLLGQFMYDSLCVRDAQHEAMVDAFTGKTISYDKILQDTCNLAEALRTYGCNSNSIISVCSENSLNFFTPVLAGLYLGAAIAPINHSYTEDELRHALTLYQPKMVFCSKATVEKFVCLQPKIDFVMKLVLLEDNETVHGIQNYVTFIDQQLDGRVVEPKSFRPFTQADPCENVSFIMSSSGTTGLPKGVMLTDRNFIVRILQSRETMYFRDLENKTRLGLMPFFHSFGLNFALGSIANKKYLVVFKKFDEDVFLKSIQDYQIPTIAVAPVLAVFLAKSPKVDKYNLSCIEEILCGAAPMSKEVENTLKKRLNVKSVRQGYGLTEVTLAATMMKGDDIEKPGSSGQVISSMSLKVRNPDSGKSLGPNQVGEICVKGPLVMKGYYRNPQATRDSFTNDGYLLTGDLGYYDKDGYFFIVDRLKELIKYKAFQVAPAELESIILNHPKVLDVGVVGKPDEEAGELPLAFVVRKPGIIVSEQELADYVSKKVSPHKRLRGGVIFLDAIPKNASGKILRRELRKMIPKSRASKMSKL